MDGQKLQYGDIVEIPGAFGTRRAKVLEVYGPRGNKHVYVEVLTADELPEPLTVTYRLEDVRRLSAA